MLFVKRSISLISSCSEICALWDTVPWETLVANVPFIQWYRCFTLSKVPDGSSICLRLLQDAPFASFTTAVNPKAVIESFQKRYGASETSCKLDCTCSNICDKQDLSQRTYPFHLRKWTGILCPVHSFFLSKPQQDPGSYILGWLAFRSLNTTFASYVEIFLISEGGFAELLKTYRTSPVSREHRNKPPCSV